jgi:UDP-3-O-[3-hydroxymyristoyl] glucosamine N-acyltransferase
VKGLLYAATLVLPWPIRRRVLCRFFGYRLHPTARIGVSWVFPRHLEMGPGSRIGHFTVCKGLDVLQLAEHAIVGRANWITGWPKDDLSQFVDGSREPRLTLGAHAAITHRHLLDCTAAVSIGAFTTVAGYRSQLLTHSIDIDDSRQKAFPITIGRYCFIGTNCVLLGGSSLPDYSVLGAKSLLNKEHVEPYKLYGGTPATPLKALRSDAAYFNRPIGFVA